MNVNETGLYGVVKEDTSKKGQILNSYKVKTLTKVENGEIYDGLKARDEENFSELNSTLEACEEIDSSVSSKFSGYKSSGPGGERRDLVVRDIGIQVGEMENREGDKSLKLDQEVLVNNEKLRTALKEEIERHKKVKMKYKAVEEELRIAEETVRDVTSIEIDLRELLRSREEENELLKDKLGRIKKIRFEEENESEK